MEPDDDVQTALLVFDGECGFCTAAVDWLARHLERPTCLVPWQQLQPGLLGLSEEDLRRSVWWIEPTGERFHSERAVAHALIACGRGWRRLGLLLLAPGVHALAAVGYRLVARVRRRLPGTIPACRADGSPVRCPPQRPG
jgi:predicted DCC family thiol-disulfide oxidoreductase YuxK